MQIYELPPIDHWYGAMDEDTFRRMFCRSEFNLHGMAAGLSTMSKFITMAEKLFREAGWEGDCREGPYFFAVPTDDGMMRFGYIVKQDNNGTTYVASPYPIAHLTEYLWVP